jgi:hypothetical protein
MSIITTDFADLYWTEKQKNDALLKRAEKAEQALADYQLGCELNAAAFCEMKNRAERVEEEKQAETIRGMEITATLNAESLRLVAKLDALRKAAEDMLSTYRHDSKTVLVSAERQEAWIAALKGAEL